MQNNDTFDVFYKKEPYDLYNFLNNHPGGINYLAPYKEKDVAKRMEETSHSKAAYYLFQEYKKGEKRKKGDTEEDLERLVDWDKPMLYQVGGLGTKYKEWVISPVDRKLRLFENPILENLTITPWYVVPLVWIPIILFLLKFGTRRYEEVTKDTASPGTIGSHVLLGVILWSFIEYSLHRWVFHMECSGHSKIMIYVHFAIHGLHHKVPFDTQRLVFPPVPAAVICYTLYKIFSFVIPEASIILVITGGLLGYVTYDMIHFYLHYGTPKENSYFYHLKRYHNQHHFAHHESGYGISSVFWDKIFGTAIHLKRLQKSIIW